MMAEADIEADGEIDFQEFCALIAECDLHPTLCRCARSQHLRTRLLFLSISCWECVNDVGCR